MIVIKKEANFNLWDAAGIFRLLSCADKNNLRDYKKFNDSLFDTFYMDIKVTQKKDITGVYILYFKNSGKFYIGSSVNVALRVAAHFHQLKNGTHQNNHMLSIYKKYKIFPEVIYLNTFGLILARHAEQRLIDLVFMDRWCLNQKQQVVEYRPSTEETLTKQRESARKQWADEDFKKKIREINKQPKNLQVRVEAAIRNAKNPDYIKKLSEASKKIWENEEYLENQRRSGAAVWEMDGFRERHSNAMKSKWADPEYRARLAKITELRQNDKRRGLSIDGKIYAHAQLAAKDLGVSINTVRRRCVSAIYATWIFL